MQFGFSPRRSSHFGSNLSPKRRRRQSRIESYLYKTALRSGWLRAFENLESRVLLSTTPGDATWVEQGPQPILSAQLNIPSANSPATGAIESIAINPTVNADGTSQMYVGTVNGGVWRADNASAANSGAISWQPLTDQAASLSIGSVAFSPLDSTGNTLFAGTGSLSSRADEGGPDAGILRTTDGGATWSNFAVDPSNEPRIKTVLPTSINLAASGGVEEMVLVAAIGFRGPDGGGLYRSNDNGQTFTLQSGSDTNGSVGLPSGEVTSVLADPLNVDRFYAGVRGAGIFRGDFDPATQIITWTNVGNNIPAADLTSSSDIQFAASSLGGTTTLYAGINDDSGFAGVFHSADDGNTWTALGTPSGFGASPFYQASFSMVVDPTDSQIVYLSGGGINIFRYDPTAADWVGIGNYGPTNIYPHADSRDLAFLGTNTLVESDDGGIYYLPNPQQATASTSQWGSLIGQNAAGQQALGVTEVNQVAWDPNSEVAIASSQDNGVEFENQTGGGAWTLVAGGDGGGVAVDSQTLSANNQSIRYFTSAGNSTPPLAYLTRQTYAPNNAPVGGAVSIKPNGLSGFNGLFNTPLVLDAVAPTAAQLAAGQSTRLVVGGYQSTNPVYESNNAGTAAPANIAWTVVPVSTPGTYTVDALAAGGMLAGVGNPDVLYAGLDDGTSALVYVRRTAGDALTPTASPFPGGNIMGISLDPTDWTHALVISSSGIWETTNSGTTWTDRTGNLTNTNLRTVNYMHLATGDVILVGGQGGVFAMFASQPGVWQKFGPNLPNAVTYSLAYDPTNDVLVAGTLGRGVWTIAHLSTLLVRQASTITSADSTTVKAGVADTFIITASGTPTAAITEIGSLPSGVSLSDNHDGTATLAITAAAAAGNYSFTIDASNGIGAPASQPFTLTITAPHNLQLTNDVYVVGSGAVSVAAGQGVLANDKASSQLTVTSGNITGAQGGTFAFNADGSFTYTPAANFPGFDHATYTAADAGGDTASATVTVLSHTGAVVWKFYESMLDRGAEEQGLVYWIAQFNSGQVPLSQLAVSFFAGDELQTRIITDYYLQYLGRQPEASGLAYWKAQWTAAGGPEDVQAGFANSPEFTAQNGNTASGWVTGLYEKILNRAPEPQGLAYWISIVQQLDQQDGKSFVDDGQARFTVAAEILKSTEEYTDIVVPGWFEQFVQRQPTSTELTTYVNELLAGTPDRTVEQQIIDQSGVADDVPTAQPATAAVLPDFSYVPLVERSNQAVASSQATISADAVFTKLGQEGP